MATIKELSQLPYGAQVLYRDKEWYFSHISETGQIGFAVLFPDKELNVKDSITVDPQGIDIQDPLRTTIEGYKEGLFTEEEVSQTMRDCNVPSCVIELFLEQHIEIASLESSLKRKK